MKSPITGKEMTRMVKDDTLVFRKENFAIRYHYYLCEDSGEEFTDEAFDEINLAQVYNQYREKNNLPFPDEIKETREKYGVSALKMAEILGFGVNSYRQYENGEVPSISNARLIQAAKDPVEFWKLALASGVLSGKVLDDVKKRVDELKAQNKFDAIQLPQYLMAGFRPNRANIFTGYRTPSLRKLIEMIVFFTVELKPWKTKMNKLLFYADFCNYKQTGYSISGAIYKAIQMGPVPVNFGSIFEYAATKDFVDITYLEFANGGIGEAFTPNTSHAFDPALFEEAELKTLQYIANKFAKASTNDMINLSHDEPGWAENFTDKKIISYEYAFKLLHA